MINKLKGEMRREQMDCVCWARITYFGAFFSWFVEKWIAFALRIGDEVVARLLYAVGVNIDDNTFYLDVTLHVVMDLWFISHFVVQLIPDRVVTDPSFRWPVLDLIL